MNIYSLVPLLLQLSLPVAIKSRYGHSAIVFGYEPTFRVAVFFGGKESLSSGELFKTTLLLMDMVLIHIPEEDSLLQFCPENCLPKYLHKVLNWY